MLLRAIVISVLGLALSFPGISHGQEGNDWRQSLRRAVVSGEGYWKSEPVLYEPTGSYFQLVWDGGGQRGNGVRWSVAESKAAAMHYADRRGRLAVIDDPKLFEWLLLKFDLRGLGYGGNTWIGLRYWCSYRQMTWADGKEHPFSAFTAWGTPWSWDNHTCDNSNLLYMGTYIDGNTMRWKAVGELKAMAYYLVEYPPDPPATAKANPE